MPPQYPPTYKSVILLKNPRSITNPAHLHFVISKPTPNGKMLLVSLTKDNGKHERVCVLKMGDHPFITCDSVVNYGEFDVLEATEEMLKTIVDNKAGVPYEDVSAPVLKKIQDGARTSVELQEKHEHYFDYF